MGRLPVAYIANELYCEAWRAKRCNELLNLDHGQCRTFGRCRFSKGVPPEVQAREG